MDSGELCVMMDLVKMMPILFADSWDTTVQTNMIISQCECLLSTVDIYFYYIFARRGNSSQPVWLSNIPCTSTRSCLSDCIDCPSSRSCDHFEDITIECRENHCSTL